MENCNLNLPHFIAGVQKVGKSMHGLNLAAKFTKKSVKSAKKQLFDIMRDTRLENYKELVIENVLKREPELFCIGCELEGSFCEGRRCEWQSETFFERDYTRAEWKYIFYKNIGDRYYNLSLRNKIKLLK